MNKYEQKIEFLKGYFLRNLEVKPDPFKYLEDLEKEIGGVLPNDYKEFLIDYGSVLAFHNYVIYPLLVPCPSGNWQMVGVFFGFSPNDSYNLVKNYHTFKDRLPREHVNFVINQKLAAFRSEVRGQRSEGGRRFEV